MRRSRMLVFFLIVLTIYFLANLYLYFKGYNSFPGLKEHRLLYSIVFFSLATIFIIAKVIEARHSSVIADILNVAGGFWLAFMLYGIMFFLISDIISLLLRLTGVLNTGNIMVYRKWAFMVTLSASACLIIGGFINAVIPVVKKYDISIAKSAGDVKSMRIAAVSDIHLGSIIRKRSMKKLTGILADLKPDLVLLLGDIVDGEIGPVMRGDLLQYLECPKCDYGMLGITGNHEFIGGAKHTIPYIESKGIRLLKDEMLVLNGGIQLIGRKDRDSDRFYGGKRLTLAELMEQADTARPVILLDHQPFGYDEAARLGVDLELSGHTHNGQMWPLNYITRMIYELSYGYLRKGNTQFIVSSGFGLWGPRVRSASHSEILLINIKFNGKDQN
ncbi:MAG TPA: metallophosphoesterase [Bacteroidales bacterium]|nr:metallophosphoesterase [Bacteroidales bacterium]